MRFIPARAFRFVLLLPMSGALLLAGCGAGTLLADGDLPSDGDAERTDRDLPPDGDLEPAGEDGDAGERDESDPPVTESEREAETEPEIESEPEPEPEADRDPDPETEADPDPDRPTYPNCIRTCTGRDQCAIDRGAYSGDNWECRGGRCRWTGCRTDDECRITFNDPDYGCAWLSGWTVGSCALRCALAADCATDRGMLSEDNYACETGFCRHLGCTENAECAITFQQTGFVCAEDADYFPGYRSCVRGCATPADCATLGIALYDARHYECTGGACFWRGCLDDTECRAAMQDTSYSCLPND